MSLRIERGRLTVLVDASSSCKTTRLTLMGCLREVQSGSVRLLGTELRILDREERIVILEDGRVIADSAPR